ncbi:MAG: phosphatase PAP2 family protein [Muribaculaceae bacterium]|nr:phosphatase PAP2 family protein [Muribaculaceae bacterium]
MKHFVITLATVAAIAFCSGAQNPYFTIKELADGTNYLPAPPDTTSVLYANDMNCYFLGKALRDTERGQVAVSHANGVYTHICAIFSPAFGLNITPTATPAIYTMLANSLKTCSNACSSTKTHYRRRRPFQVFNDPLGTGETLSATSFPSSHSAKGWIVALLLSELNPAAQEALLKLGYEYGQSRVIVGAHWQSDVDASRMIGSATYARLRTSPRFVEEMAAAQAEYARLTGTAAAPQAAPETTTAIDSVSADGDDDDTDQWYTITGQPATPATQGIVVSRNRKTVRKN